MSINSCLSMRHDYSISGWFCWKCNTVISLHTRTGNFIRIYLSYLNGKCLPGIMRTKYFPLRLHTTQGISLSCKLPNPEGSRLPPTSYSAPYSTSLAYAIICYLLLDLQ